MGEREVRSKNKFENKTRFFIDPKLGLLGENNSSIIRKEE